MIFVPGDLIEKRYKVINYLTKGGMSEIYEGYDTKTRRKVVLKILNKIEGKNFKVNFKRLNKEIELMSKISHPNIIEIIDFYLTKPYVIVLEYIKGESLKKVINKRSPLHLKEIIIIMKQLLNAMIEVEKKDIVHRDLKPQNIIITPSGLLKILDFGISTRARDTSNKDDKNIVGSVQYMPPEIIEKKEINSQCDIYSMGIILYELLTGSVPFSGSEAVKVAIMHVHKEVPSIKTLSTEFHDDLDYIVRKATARNRDDRYASFVDFKTDFDNFSELVKEKGIEKWNVNKSIKRKNNFFKNLFSKNK